MIRIVWTGLIAGIALVAIGAQLDRQSRIDHHLAPIVPAPFRSDAQQVIADGKLAQDNPREALDEAVRLVRRRPVPAENLLALVLADQAAGRNVQAIRTLGVAARRGWRGVRLQELQLRVAIGAGDPAEAANRLAALWAVGGEGRDLTEPTRLVLSTSAGREAFARQIAHAEGWPDTFLRSGNAMLAPDVYALTAGAALRAGAQFDCNLLSKTARNMAGQGRIALAASLWSGECARGVRVGASGGGFEPDDAAPKGPLDWYYPQDTMIDRHFTRTGSGWAMDYRCTEPISGQLAQKYLELAPGRHALSIASRGGKGELTAIIACIDESGRTTNLASRRDDGILAFDVPAAACAALLMSFRAEPGSREALRVSLD